MDTPPPSDKTQPVSPETGACGGAPIRVVVVEDNDVVRTALSAIVRMAPDLSLCAAFEDGESAIQYLAMVKPDVVLMDMRLPGQSGIECARWVHLSMPETRVIMLSIEEDSMTVVNALEAGASGYLLKPSEPVVILDAIREAHRGGTPLTQSLARKLTRVLGQRGTGADELLSERDEEILRYVAQGYRAKAVADLVAKWGAELGLLSRSLGDHLMELFSKIALDFKLSKKDGAVGAVEEVLIADVGEVLRDLARVLVPKRLAVVTIEIHGAPEAYGVPRSLLRALGVPLLRGAARSIGCLQKMEATGRIHIVAHPLETHDGLELSIEDSGVPLADSTLALEQLLTCDLGTGEGIPDRLRLLRSVRTMIEAFRGQMEVGVSRLGGVRVQVRLSLTDLLKKGCEGG